MWVKPRAELRPFTPPLHHSRKASTLRFQAAGFRPLVASVPLVAIASLRKTAKKRTRSTKRPTERRRASLCFLPSFSFSVFQCFSFPLSPHAAALGRFGGGVHRNGRAHRLGRGIDGGGAPSLRSKKRVLQSLHRMIPVGSARAPASNSRTFRKAALAMDGTRPAAAMRRR